MTASPTNRLMLAVLEEALASFQKGLSSCRAEQRRRSCEVDRWVASTDESFVFSFESICSSLSIDAGYVREGLKRLRIAARQGLRVHNPHVVRRERMYGRRAWRGRIRVADSRA
jgi:hypothetical protein